MRREAHHLSDSYALLTRWTDTDHAYTDGEDMLRLQIGGDEDDPEGIILPLADWIVIRDMLARMTAGA